LQTPPPKQLTLKEFAFASVTLLYWLAKEIETSIIQNIITQTRLSHLLQGSGYNQTVATPWSTHAPSPLTWLCNYCSKYHEYYQTLI
jgi:hypothetical protein